MSFNEIWANNVNLTTVALEDWIDSQIEIANFVASDSRIIDGCINPSNGKIVNEMNEYLLEINNKFIYIENIAALPVTDKDYEIIIKGENVHVKAGDVVVISDSVGMKPEIADETIAGKNVTEVPYIKAILSGKNYFISGVYPSFRRGNPIVTVNVPIRDGENLVGVFVMALQMDYFSERYIDRLEYEKTGKLFMLDGSGVLIAHHNRDFILNRSDELSYFSEQFVEKILNGERFFSKEFMGDQKYYVFDTVEISKENIQYPWYIGFTQENEELFADAYRLLKLIVVIGIIIAPVLILLVYFILENYYKKIDKQNLIKINETLEIKVDERTKILKQMAITDSLTKLYNHKYSMEKLKEEIVKAKENNKSLVLLMLDLDYFKKVNDLYGHQIGDEVLIKVSEKIKSSIRKDDLAGRYGGEEFLIILKNTSLEDGISIAEKIRVKILNMKFSIPELNITTSIGCCKLDDENMIDLIKKSDEALYFAKENGRNRVEVCKK